jgi:hypothetical protein
MSRARPVAAAARTSVPPPHAESTWLDVRGPYLLPLLVLLAARAWLATRVPTAAEDAYITFRYAWNLARGAGAVFNPGEHVYGFTSAPWMTWLALGLRVGQDPLLWARLTLVLADAVTLVTVGSLLERHVSRTSAWCFCLMVALWPYCAALAVSGLEMNAFIALIALSAWLVDRRHPGAGAALGLLAVFRPEGVLAVAVLAIWARRRDRLIALAIVAAVLGVLALYYGSPVPQSVRAKAIAYGAPGPLHSRAWWDWVLPFPLSGGLSTTSEGKGLILFSLVASPAALAGGVALWKQRTSAVTAVALAALAVWSSYILVGASYFFWYMATPVFCWMTLVAVGLPRIATGRWLSSACAAALLATWLFHPRLFISRAAAEEYLFGLAGDYVAQNAAPGASVMLEPIGTIGWRARTLKLIDEVGLVSPAVAERRARGAGWYADVLAAERPEWLVVREGLLSRGATFTGVGAPFRGEADRQAAMSAYEVVAMVDSTKGDQNLVILRRTAPR